MHSMSRKPSRYIEKSLMPILLSFTAKRDGGQLSRGGVPENSLKNIFGIIHSWVLESDGPLLEMV